LSALKHDILPYYGQRAKSRIYRFIIERQLSHKRKKEAGKTILGQLRRSRRLFASSRPYDAKSLTSPSMFQQLGLKDAEDSFAGNGSSQGRGSRRRKLADYLKAANELRQSYQQAYGLGGQNEGEAGQNGSAEAAVVRTGDEEMVLFPSYARQHQTRKNRPVEAPGATQDLRNNQDSGDSEYWRGQWVKYEDDNSIVDVDVRGWVYSPHRGAMTRKNRVLLGLARHLSGIPAPAPNGGNGVSIPAESRMARPDEELVEMEADSILKRGEAEVDCAQQGRYSEPPTGQKPSSERELKQDRMPHRLSRTSLQDAEESGTGSGSLAKRFSWSQPSEMTPTELAVANAHLMARLKPFLTTPLVSLPVSIFFYNDQTSKSRIITTDESGHFSLRAALDFVPTHVRVLASERLSATEEVRVTGPRGVSVISDIDDTIKHSAIGSGAKEIFRNVFVRDLGDLTIGGVKEWYSKMADLGVQFHYVSNSPWQLYPLLVTFFAGAGLPKGSFHLKQYSGMLQGIFEPVAERKKGTLERILQDFPERHFILVGDSGEADLELYTDIVLSNPGRILGAFIRDVTTTKPKGFFDSSMSEMTNGQGSRSSLPLRQPQGGTDPPAKSIHNDDKRRTLPSRQQTRSTSTLRSTMTGRIGGVAELPLKGLHRSMTEMNIRQVHDRTSSGSTKSPPIRPVKPLALRSPPSGPYTKAHPIPPIITTPNPRANSTSQGRLHSLPPNQKTSPGGSGSGGPSVEPQGYRSLAMKKIASTYNALPAWSSPVSVPPPQAPTPPPRHIQPELPFRPKPPSTPTSGLAPPVPPRRTISSYPAAAANYATNRLSGGWSGHNIDASPDDINANPTNPINKKEELWNRRWARAKEIFEAKGVMLKTWRDGGDVMEDVIRLVEKVGKEGMKDK
jgi:phosphatidate phosphatase APP1